MLVLAASVYFVSLGNSAIWDANEAFYVETPREMLEAHDFLNPTFNYEPRFNKPVLSYWIVAVVYRPSACPHGPAFRVAIGAFIIIGCRLRPRASDDAGMRDWRFTMRDRGSGWGIRDQRIAGLWAAAGWRRRTAGDVRAAYFIDIWINRLHVAHSVFFCAERALPRTAAAVPRPDVRVDRVAS